MIDLINFEASIQVGNIMMETSIQMGKIMMDNINLDDFKMKEKTKYLRQHVNNQENQTVIK